MSLEAEQQSQESHPQAHNTPEAYPAGVDHASYDKGAFDAFRLLITTAEKFGIREGFRKTCTTLLKVAPEDEQAARLLAALDAPGDLTLEHLAAMVYDCFSRTLKAAASRPENGIEAVDKMKDLSAAINAIINPL